MQIREIVNNAIYYMIKIFGVIVFLIGILLILYYITPNNFELTKVTDNFEKFKFVNQVDLEILKKSNQIFDDNNNYLMFDREVEMIIQNTFKSQKIILEPTQMIKIKNKNKNNSVAIILNDSDENLKLVVKMYDL